MVAISEVAEVNPSLPKNLNFKPESLVSFLPMAAVSESGIITTQHERSFGEVSKGYTYFAEGDVLMAKITPCMENGKATFVQKLKHSAGFGSTEFHVLRPSSEIDGKYLFYMIWNPLFRKVAGRNMTGTAGQKRVPSSFLKDFKIPLPPLPEQKRIAAILDKADSIRRKRQASVRLTEDLLRSVFLDMFGDPVTNPKGWEICRLGDVVDKIEGGWSPVCEESRAEENEWGVLKLGAVTSCRYLDSENKALIAGTTPRPDLEVKPGDLLFTRKNTYDLVAASALVFSTRPKLMLSDLIFRLKLENDAAVTSEYLWALLTNSGKRKQIQSLAGGSSGSMPNISKSKLMDQIIEVPPMALQNKYTKILHGNYSIRNKLEVSFHANNILFNSLLQRAFKGEL